MTTLSRLTALALSVSLATVGLASAALGQVAPPAADTGKARNVILFLADAGGVSVLSAASLMGYGEPMRLHVQKWPHLGLSETSPVDAFVSDSANGMSAIVTGVKTRNGVISQGPEAVRGQTDGAQAKSLLEYAEERGLRTGVVSTQAITDATPAAVYAHANDRAKWGEIFPQAFAPRFGDGVDVLLGAGRKPIGEQLAARGSSFEALSATHSSFGLQVDGGQRGEPLLEGYDAWKAGGATADMVRLKNVLVNDSHTAEEVPVLAIGAGAQRIRGYFPNTHLFKVMLDAWGWKADAPPSN